MKCFYCNAELPPDAKVCPQCNSDNTLFLQSAEKQPNTTQPAASEGAFSASQPSASPDAGEQPEGEAAPAGVSSPQGEPVSSSAQPTGSEEAYTSAQQTGAQPQAQPPYGFPLQPVDTQSLLHRCFNSPALTAVMVLSIIASALSFLSSISITAFGSQFNFSLTLPMGFVFLAVSAGVVRSHIQTRTPISPAPFTLIQVLAILVLVLCGFLMLVIAFGFAAQFFVDTYYEGHASTAVPMAAAWSIELFVLLFLFGLLLLFFIPLLLFCSSVRKSIYSNVPNIKCAAFLSVACIIISVVEYLYIFAFITNTFSIPQPLAVLASLCGATTFLLLGILLRRLANGINEARRINASAQGASNYYDPTHGPRN